MAKEEKYHNRSNEDREQEAREYLESQEPVVREEPLVLNPDGGNVPEEGESVRRAGRAADYDGMTVEELRSEAGDLEVTRADGEAGSPLKADYVKALRKRDRSR